MGKTSGFILIFCGLAVVTFGMWPVVDIAEPQPNRSAISLLPASTFPVEGTGQELPTLNSAPVVVTTPRHPNAEVRAPAAAILRDRDTLARELQKELQRIGCYEGELNGAWTPSTRRAMKAFTERVNATLPVQEPDNILYAMVQSHQEKVCGTPCPSGEGLSKDGRCLPTALLQTIKKNPARATVTNEPRDSSPLREKASPTITGWSITITASPVEAPTSPPAQASSDARMALAGPPSEEAPPTVPVPAAALPSPHKPPAARVVPSSRRDANWTRRVFDRRDSL